jgi:hypothetical protein
MTMRSSPSDIIPRQFLSHGNGDGCRFFGPLQWYRRTVCLESLASGGASSEVHDDSLS